MKELSLDNVYVSGSILSADFACLGRVVKELCSAGVDFVHVDVMDGHFVPNLTIGPMVVSAIKRSSTVPLDVHLMMSRPSVLLDSFIKAGSNRITLHAEIEEDVRSLLMQLKEKGVDTGLCLKPATPAETIIPYLDLLDQVLVMTVEPGFGGQDFRPELVKKIYDVKKIIQGRFIQIEVDGGLNDKTAPNCVKAGADILVAGNYILKSSDWHQAIMLLKGQQ